jgi:hypothetical protein
MSTTLDVNGKAISTSLRVLLSIVALLIATSRATAQSNQSVYTNLDAKLCRTLKSSSAEGGEYVGQCPGVAGYKLIVSEGDLRQNIEVVTPGGRKHSLDLWEVISSAFSSVGPKAEWRLQRMKGKLSPVALIVRYNASENPEDSSKITSYLAVAKVTATEICVTDKISPAPNANEAARQAADQATAKPCLKSQK